MRWAEIVLVCVLVLAVFGTTLWVTANRLDRLHRKVSASRMALDAQLVRRASAAVDLATSGLLDPASAIVVADAAYAVLDDDATISPGEAVNRALHADSLGDQREREESTLSATLRSALDDAGDLAELNADPAGSQLAAALAAAWYRAQLARRFHNEAVAQSVRARRHWYVRWFRLAGYAPMPQTVELDDNEGNLPLHHG
ncbi:MAG: hypothetical protein LBB54_01780 [Cellulomonadaceae bacterium]|jgi:hypothetical protein|nr:hypothetical protein [Cellulomonadaceae bacterium]